jgi:hypothetical protein
LGTLSIEITKAAIWLERVDLLKERYFNRLYRSFTVLILGYFGVANSEVEHDVMN